MQYFVYAIGKTEDLNKHEKCYIGVTNQPEKRWKKHQSSTHTVGCFIRENKLTYTDNMCVIFIGSEKECYEKEKELRPYPNMGLNEAIGGLGGHTSYSKERNKKISDALKSRTVTWGDKVSRTKKANGSSAGSKNSKAKKWLIISPENKIKELHGNVEQFCKESLLSVGALRRYKNTVVPPIVSGKKGGYRATSEEFLKRRHNTTGWCLKEI